MLDLIIFIDLYEPEGQTSLNLWIILLTFYLSELGSRKRVRQAEHMFYMQKAWVHLVHDPPHTAISDFQAQSNCGPWALPDLPQKTFKKYYSMLYPSFCLFSHTFSIIPHYLFYLHCLLFCPCPQRMLAWWGLFSISIDLLTTLSPVLSTLSAICIW